MRIDRLTVENFRCFEHFTLELDPRCNVLIGENASGKTALLDALAGGLEGWVESFVSTSGDGERLLAKADVRFVRRNTKGLPELARLNPSTVAIHWTVEGESGAWKWRYDADDVDPLDTFWIDNPLKSIAARLLGAVSTEEGKDTTHLPVVAVYRSLRHWSLRTGESVDLPGFRSLGYEGALHAGANLRHLFDWMDWRTSARAEAIVNLLDEGLDTKTAESPELDAVSDTVASCIPECKRFYFSVDQQELRIELENGQIFPFDSLSDGYRNFVGMVADLAWRCVRLNPHLGKDAPEQTGGVVLIDEIDLHLYPSWQRRVLDWLLEAFPKVQFVVTTHSPQVIASAQPEWIRILDPKRNEAILVDHVHGKDTNTILQQVMGVAERPDEMQKKLDELARDIQDERFEAAQKLLDEITEDLGTMDPEVVGLTWELSMARAGIHAED